MRRSTFAVSAIGLFWASHALAQTQSAEAGRDAMLARAKAAQISDAWLRHRVIRLAISRSPMPS